MSENKLKIPNSFETYFALSIILLTGGAFASLFAIANSKLLVPEEVLTQSVSVVIMYLIIIVVNGLLFKALGRIKR